MNVAYISGPMLSDVDISFLTEAQKKVDITYFVQINKHRIKGAAFNLTELYPKSGIFKAVDIYPELHKFTKFIDEDKFYVINNTASKGWHISNILLNITLLFRLSKFNIIHTTDFFAFYEWIFYLLRKKIVLTVHDPFTHSSKKHNRKIILICRKIGFKLLRNFVILNKEQRDGFIKTNKLSSKKVFDSRLGRYDYLRLYETEIRTPYKYILFFGQISSYKGLDILFPAMERVHIKHPDVKLVVAGKGKYNFNINKYLELDYFDIQNRFIPDDELSKLIQGAMFVVCPYRDATQSGVIMSAYAFNKPIIATNVGGLPEMVQDGMYGNIIPPNDISSLTQAISELIDSPDRLASYSSNINIDYSKGDKSWENIACQMINIYHEIWRNHISHN